MRKFKNSVTTKFWGDRIHATRALATDTGLRLRSNFVHTWARRLPWIDGFAGLSVGLAMLLFRSVLADFYSLSLQLVTFIALANIFYAAPGISLGLMRQRSAWLLWFLIFANLVWTIVCITLSIHVWSTANVFGLTHILGEGLFVTRLAYLEWRHRNIILANNP